MGQILDRIFNIDKTYFNEAGNGNSFQNILNQEDEELKRIIDELNNNNENKSGSSSNKQNQSYNNQSNSNSNSNSNKRYKTQDNKSQTNYTQNNSSQKNNTRTQIPKNVIDALNLLELNQNSNIEQIGVEQIKKQYKKMIALNHPDRFQNKSEIEKKSYEVKASQINNAYNVLKNHYNF